MPTGYTADIEKGISFETFVLRCARAFGACIMQRDDSSDELPKLQESSKYHEEELVKQQKEKKEIETMTIKEIEAIIENKYATEIKQEKKYAENNIKLKQKYEKMLAAVEAWNPPTSDHIELKNFMVKQIIDSIKFDCWCEDERYKYKERPIKLSPELWRAKKLEKINKDIAYHTKEGIKEVKRTESCNLWIRQLYESLGRKAPQPKRNGD